MVLVGFRIELDTLYYLIAAPFISRLRENNFSGELFQVVRNRRPKSQQF